MASCTRFSPSRTAGLRHRQSVEEPASAGVTQSVLVGDQSQSLGPIRRRETRSSTAGQKRAIEAPYVDVMSNSSTPTAAPTQSPDQRRTAWEAYASIWKVAGAEAKLAACAEHLSSTCVYTDPHTHRRGWNELVEYMVEFHAGVPGGHFVTTEFRAHGDKSIALWNMVAGDGTVLGNGASYGEYDRDGRVKTMTGFFDTPEDE